MPVTVPVMHNGLYYGVIEVRDAASGDGAKELVPRVVFFQNFASEAERPTLAPTRATEEPDR